LPATDGLSPADAVSELIAFGGTPVIAFDLGGVLLRGGVLTSGSEAAAFNKLEQQFGLPAGPTSRMWHELLRPSEIGEISESTVWTMLASQVPGVDPSSVREAMLEMASPIDEGIGALKDIHDAGWRTALATNHLDSWVKEWKARFDWFDYIDVVVVSSKIGLRKPDLGYYENLKSQLEVESPWFVDDRSENLVAARKSGLRVVWVDTSGRWFVNPDLEGPTAEEGGRKLPDSKAT
jgi:HAD superfamily hydrolase (TIGR01509 family)